MRKFRTALAVAALAAVALLVPRHRPGGAPHNKVVPARAVQLAFAGMTDHLTDDR